MARKKSMLPARGTQLIPDEGSPIPDGVIDDIFNRAQSGDETVADDIRRYLARPDRSMTVCVKSPLALAIEAGSGKNVLAREAAFHEIRELKRDLAGPNPTALDEMLVDQVVMCRFLLQDAEIRYITAINREGGMSFDQGDYLQRRITASQKRYNSAVMTLAKVRRLQLPDITIAQAGQVNIGEQQVNVAEVSEQTEIPRSTTRAETRGVRP